MLDPQHENGLRLFKGKHTPPRRLKLDKIRCRRRAIGQKTGFGDFFLWAFRKTAGAVHPSQLSIVHVSCVEGTQTTSSVLILRNC